jgi:hypothetical protein
MKFPPDLHLFRQHGDLTYGIVASTAKIILAHGLVGIKPTKLWRGGRIVFPNVIDAAVDDSETRSL